MQVSAGPALTAALLQAPLRVSVYKQPAAAAGSGGASSAGFARSAVLVGMAELDLAPLLWPASSHEEDEARSLAGTYPLLEGAAASQGGASLAARVQLQLAPAVPAAKQAAAALGAGADAASGTWLLEELGDECQPQGAESASPCQPFGAHGSRPSFRVQAQAPAPEQHGHQHQHPQQGRVHWYPSPSSSDDEDEDELLLQRCKQLTAASSASREQQHAAAGSHPGADSSSAGSARSPSRPSSSMQQQQQEPADSGEGSAVHQQAGSANPGHSQGASRSQQPVRMPTHGSTTDSATHRQGEQQQQQQPVAALQQPEEQTAPAAVEGGCLLVIQVETALHLPVDAPAPSGSVEPSTGSSSSNSYSAYVQAVWQQRRQRTAAVPVHAVDAGSLGGTAVWQEVLEVGPATAAMWAHAHTSEAGGPTLLLNVWATAAGSSNPTGSRPGSAAAAAAAPPLDQLVGCATLDLSALPRGEQRGWFHLIDSQQRRRGQLKVAVCPDAVLLRQLLEQQAGTPSPARAVQAAEEGPVLGFQAGGHGGDLQQQLAAQLQELELLSRRLSAAPPAAAPPAAAAAEPPAAAAAASGGPVPGPALPDAALLRQLPASDDEADDAAPFDARQVCAGRSGIRFCTPGVACCTVMYVHFTASCAFWLDVRAADAACVGSLLPSCMPLPPHCCCCHAPNQRGSLHLNAAGWLRLERQRQR